MFTIPVEVYLTSEKMPEPYQCVLVEGGVAFWTGHVNDYGNFRWRTAMEQRGEVITWPVLWWAKLLHVDSIISMTALG